jgi:transcriptional regulator GlxA family with amidase domain
MSVCTGALVLAAAGLLQNREATTHWSALDLLQASPSVRVVDGVRFVYADDIATSAGVSAGIDLALEIVRRQFGDDVAQQVAHMMEYTPSRGNVRSSTS